VGYLLLVVGLVVLLVETLVIHRALRNGRRARLIARTAALEVSRLDDGVAKVRGQAVALSGALTAPLSGKACVYYRFRAEEQRRHASPHGGSTYWKTVVDDAQSVPCGVDDGTGIVAVSLAEAELVLARDRQARSGFWNSAPPELEEMLRQRYGRSSRGWIFNKTMRYSETLIEEGDDLLVLGTAEATPGGNWQLVRGEAPLIVTDRGEASLLSSYRTAAFLWWLLAVLVLAVVSLIAGVVLH